MSQPFWFAGKLIFIGSYWASNPAVCFFLCLIYIWYNVPYLLLQLIPHFILDFIPRFVLYILFVRQCLIFIWCHDSYLSLWLMLHLLQGQNHHIFFLFYLLYIISRFYFRDLIYNLPVFHSLRILYYVFNSCFIPYLILHSIIFFMSIFSYVYLNTLCYVLCFIPCFIPCFGVNFIPILILYFLHKRPDIAMATATTMDMVTAMVTTTTTVTVTVTATAMAN